MATIPLLLLLDCAFCAKSLRNKLYDLDLDHDIAFLYETWTDEVSDIAIEGYKHWNFYREYRHRELNLF